MYKLKIENFTGPLDLLLQLIEDQKMEITEIAIAQVTEQFLAHIEKIEDRDPEELSDFLVVAARLLYLKSKAILPVQEDEEVYDDLEKQLKMYKEFVEASKKIDQMIKTGNFTFSRPKLPQELKVNFSPAPNITVKNLREVFLTILKRLDPLVKMPKQLMQKTISLQARIFELKDLIKKQEKMQFKDLFNNAKNKTEVIINFLAVLELVKQNQLTVKQGSLFDEIYIEKI
jgi:segregation and condensation protein A